MLYFNELRITSDGNNLIIDVSVDNSECFNNIKIDTIVIDNQDTYVPAGPSNNPIYTYQNQSDTSLTYALPEECNCNPVQESDEYAYCLTINNSKLRNLRLVLSSKDLPLQDDILFVYVIASGEMASSCVGDYIKMGTVANFYPYYQNMIKYVRELESTCDIPKNFIDLTLRFKAMESAIRAGNYPIAIKYWNKFFKGGSNKSNVTNCSCYG